MNTNNKSHPHPGLWSLPQTTMTASPVTDVQFDYNTTQVAADDCVQTELAELANCLRTAASQQGWVTLIGTPEQAQLSYQRHQVEQLLDALNIARHRVRWVRTKDTETNAWAAEQALLLDNSTAVVAWLGQSQQRDLHRLQLAAKFTRAQSLTYATAIATTPLH